MLAAGSLSNAAFGLRKLLIDSIEDFGNDISRIKIGHPGNNLKELEQSGDNGLNLFFYHVAHDGYPADGTADNPFFVRLYCLITAVGQETKKSDSDAERDISKGENELRLIGEVMTVLHEQPVFHLLDTSQAEIAALQIVPHSIDMDTLNHIWGTQGSETPYRLSVAYEMSLAPIPFRLPAKAAPLVGDPRMLSWGTMQRSAGKEVVGAMGLKPQVEYLEVDTSAEEWGPHIAFVEEREDSTKALHYVFSVPTSTDSISIQLAGKVGEPVKLLWNVWRRKQDNSVESWKEDIADVETPVAIIADDDSGTPFHPNRLDPDSIDRRRVFHVRLPADVSQADTKTWQATLYAVREWGHETPPGSGLFGSTQIRSNPILLYGGTP